MNARNTSLWLLGFVLAAAVAGLAAWGSLQSARSTAQGFAAQVDIAPLEAAAVHTEGRLNSLESFARYTLKYVSGPNKVNGQTPVFTYFDLMARPDFYDEADLIYIKNKTMRADIVGVLTQSGDFTPDKAAAFNKTGMISPKLLNTEGVKHLTDVWSRDLIKTAKFVDDIQGAMHLRDPQLLSSQLRLIPPPPGPGDAQTPWLSVNDLYPQDSESPDLLAKIPGAQQSSLRTSWAALVKAWRAQDAAATNKAITDFTTALRAVNPALYPEVQRLNAETTYFQLGHLTWVWVIYLISVIFLLMSVAYRWDGARAIGMGAFTVAFGLHTVAVMLRWYVSGRWPNSNMFEAVTTSVWLGTVLAVGIEIAARKTPMRNLFALCAGVASMAALMSAHYIPQLDAGIRNMMPVLHDIWLYIHTNVIIASYAIIAMAAVTASLYLVGRFFGADAAYARTGGMTLAVGGGGAGFGASGSGLPGQSRTAATMEILDGATMVLMQLSFVMLWAGIVMGAIWADHSWGRPWGWDPKEVFALNTFLLFVILVHTRLKVKDKGLWTALLAVLGCAVMLFNWIVINFIISGLHSYA